MHSIQRNTTLNLKKHWGRTAETHLWQSQFWDHVIRSDLDYDNHMGYIHYNPVKHGLVATPGDHAYSSFQEYVRRGWYGPTWSENVELAVGVRIELE